jgi:hypothetical protein
MILQPAGGNVGIGTDSPGDKLVVQGDGDGILVRSNDFTLSRIIPRGGTSTNWDKALFSLYNAATESVRIDTAGKSWFNGGFVGIGNTAPSQLFHVENTQSGTWTTRFSNTVANSNNIYFGLNTGSTSYGMYIDGGLGAAGFDIQTSGGFAVRGNGKVGIGVTNPFARLSVESPYFSSGVCADFKFTGPQSNYYGMTNIKAEVPLYGTGIRITSPTSASNDNQAMSFYQQTSFVGSISLNTSSTSYNTTSDYRLKENREEILDAIERVKELKPAKFNWIKEPEGKKVDGFYAHELAEVIPESVTGEKDALDYEGNPNYQSVDQSKVVPLLAAALQQAISKIEKLESRILTLENK